MRYPEAEVLVRRSLALAGSADVSILWLHLGAVHRAEGRLALARVETERGRHSRGVETKASGIYYVLITETEGLFDLADGKTDQAVAELRSTLEVASQFYQPSDPRLAEAQFALGKALLARQDAKEGVPMLTSACAIFRAGFGDAHPETVACGRHLAEARQAAGLQ